jgi:hypothetical protein
VNRSFGSVLIAAALAVTTVACGSETDASTERPLTPQEASLLAEVLVDNYRAGGATFQATTLDRPGGNQLQMSGDVNWVDHEGVATVMVTAGVAPDLVGWQRDAVVERWPQLAPVFAGMDTPDVAAVVRSPDMNRRLDQIIAIITAMANERAENASLITQQPGSAYLREDSLRGRPVTVLRYGQRNLYWIDAESGDLLRLEGVSREGSLPLVIDILERGPREIPLPDPGQVVSVDAVAGPYASLGPTV